MSRSRAGREETHADSSGGRRFDGVLRAGVFSRCPDHLGRPSSRRARKITRPRCDTPSAPPVRSADPDPRYFYGCAAVVKPVRRGPPPSHLGVGVRDRDLALIHTVNALTPPLLGEPSRSSASWLCSNPSTRPFLP